MKILLVTSVLPWPLRRNGGGQRSALLKKALEKIGQVDIFAVGGSALRENTPNFDAQLPAHNVVACIVRKPTINKLPGWAVGPLKGVAKTIRQYESNYELDPAINAELNRVIQQHGPYDLIVGRYLQPVIQSGADRIDGVPKLLDFDDIDWQTLESSIREKPWPGIGGKIGSQQVLSRVKRLCTSALEHFDDVFVTSEDDRRHLNRSSTVLPNIPFADNADASITPLPPDATSTRVLFVGDLQFPPNRDGLDRFLTKVWPRVTREVPGAVIDIVGRGLTDERAARWRAVPGTNVIGFADDLVALYRACAFSVVPVYFGGGTKIKVLESLAFERTVVVADHAMRGYDSLTEGDPVVAVAATDEEYAEACISLLKTPALRESMAKRGQALIAREFSFARFAAIVASKVPQEASR